MHVTLAFLVLFTKNTPMLQTLQVFLALVVLVLLIPQTTKVNFVLRKFYESGVFAYYSEAKRFLTRLTWGSIFAFFIITYLTARI